MIYLFFDLLYVLKEHLKYLLEKMYCWWIAKAIFGRNKKKAIVALARIDPYLNKLQLSAIPVHDQIRLSRHMEKDPKVKEVLDWTKHFLDSIDDQLFMFFLNKKDFQEKGPIVFCYELSRYTLKLDSMAKGLGLALATIARIQRRDFIMFLYEYDDFMIEVKKGRLTANDVIDVATFALIKDEDQYPDVGYFENVMEKMEERFENQFDMVILSKNFILNNANHFNNLQVIKQKTNSHIHLCFSDQNSIKSILGAIVY